MSTAALDILGGLIKSISTDTSKITDRTAHEEIYTYMTKSIIPTANEKHCPPLLVLGYAIREILNPTLAPNLAPELLRLLVQVEHIRQLIISNIQQALKEQEVLSQNRQKVRLLDASSTKILAKYVKKSKVQRLQYSTLTLYLRLLHIYSLWVAEESYSIPRWMKEYFPMLHLEKDEALQTDELWQSILLRDYDESERGDTHELGSHCKSFLRKAADWEADRRKMWTEQRLPFDDFYKSVDGHCYIEEFEENFPNPVDIDDTRAMTEQYLSDVEEMAKYVQGLFPSQ